MNDHGPRTLNEAYSSAINSSHLRLTERSGDIDLVIAAGLAPDSVAASLVRLANEYDGARGEHRAAEARMAADAQSDREHNALMAHVLILSRLPSLAAAKRRFGEFAILESARGSVERPAKDVLAIAGRVLDVWLSPSCRPCEGRGFFGGSHRGEMQVLCRPCRGTGHRRDSIGKTDYERKLANLLLMRISELIGEFERDLRAGKARADGIKRVIQEAGA